MNRAEHAAVAELLRVAFEGGTAEERTEAFEALPTDIRDAYAQHGTRLAGALLHATMARSDYPPGQPAAPADRVLYRDRGGDYWTCAPDGVPGMLGGKFWGELSGIRTIGDVEREYGPLHVVPWPGEVR